MIHDEADGVKNFLGMKSGWKQEWKVAILLLIVSINCIMSKNKFWTRCRSYIVFLDWLKTIKRNNQTQWTKKDNKCFQYAVSVALNHQKKQKTCKE